MTSNANTQTSRGIVGKTRELLDMIKFEHTIFALPFAYMTLFLAERGWPEPDTFLWITLAMVAARTFGMSANRLIDAGIDARNPRTATRSIPAGRVSLVEVVVFMAVALGVFLVAVWQLSPVCRRLWPIVIAAMVLYPYAKRVTPLSHLALGLVYVMVPTAVWIAVRGVLGVEAIVLGIGAGFWVAGFDIIYACQDVEVDREQKLHSLPADFGIPAALWASRVFHLLFAGSLLAAGMMLGAGPAYYAGVAAATLLLAYEHRLVTPGNLSKIDMAFFTTNGVISIVLFVLVAADAVLR